MKNKTGHRHLMGAWAGVLQNFQKLSNWGTTGILPMYTFSEMQKVRPQENEQGCRVRSSWHNGAWRQPGLTFVEHSSVPSIQPRLDEYLQKLYRK